MAVCFDKKLKLWVGRFEFCHEKSDKRFPTKWEAEKWVEEKRIEAWKPYVQKALEMYRNGESRDEIAKIFKSKPLCIDLTKYLIPTKGVQLTLKEMGQELGVSEQRAHNATRRAMRKFKFERIRQFGVPELEEPKNDEWDMLYSYINHEYSSDYDGLDYTEGF